MITAMNFETMHYFGNALPTLLRLRYSEFVERLNYEVPTYNKMEFDQYDTPAAVYFFWRDSKGEIRAGTRITPTNRPYMIGDLWPQSVQSVEVPRSPHIWEITRFFVDKELDADSKRIAHGEILCGYLEFGLRNNIKSYIGTAPPKLWRHTLIKCGWPVEFVGEPVEIGYQEKIQTGFMHVTEDMLWSVRSNMGIYESVLPDFELPMEKIAA